MYSRTRTRGGLSTQYVATEYNSSGVADAWFPASRLGKVETMTDTVIPRFHKRMRNKEVFFNAMSKSEISIQSQGGQGGIWVSTSNPSQKYTVNGDYFTYAVRHKLFPPADKISPIAIYSDSDIRDARVEATTRMLNDRGRSDSNLWESLAEVDKTLDMLRHPIAQLNNFHRKNKLRALGTTAASAWLMYRYGLRPFISDVSQILTGLNSPRMDGLLRKTTRASLRESRCESSLVTDVSGVCNTIIGIQKTDSLIIRATSLDSYQWSRARELGFDPKGLITLPWELVSGSFVADWFVNIGDFLGALVPAFGLNQLGSCLTVERTIETVYTCQGSSSNSSSYTMARPVAGGCSAKTVTKTRNLPPNPGLVIKQDFRFDKATRMADAIAVAWQQISPLFDPKRVPASPRRIVPKRPYTGWEHGAA